MVCEGQSDGSRWPCECYSDIYCHLHSHRPCTHGRKWGGWREFFLRSALPCRHGLGLVEGVVAAEPDLCVPWGSKCVEERKGSPCRSLSKHVCIEDRYGSALNFRINIAHCLIKRYIIVFGLENVMISSFFLSPGKFTVLCFIFSCALFSTGAQCLISPGLVAERFQTSP